MHGIKADGKDNSGSNTIKILERGCGMVAEAESQKVSFKQDFGNF